MSNRRGSNSFERQERKTAPCKAFVGALNYSVTANDIRDKFSPFGHIIDIQVKEGYAFVEFDNPESVI